MKKPNVFNQYKNDWTILIIIVIGIIICELFKYIF